MSRARRLAIAGLGAVLALAGCARQIAAPTTTGAPPAGASLFASSNA